MKGFILGMVATAAVLLIGLVLFAPILWLLKQWYLLWL